MKWSHLWKDGAPDRAAIEAELVANGGEEFDLFLKAAEACPAPVHDWTDYVEIRPAFVAAFAAITGEEDFEADSPLDAMAHAAFCAGWNRAIGEVALALNAPVFPLDEAFELGPKRMREVIAAAIAGSPIQEPDREAS